MNSSVVGIAEFDRKRVIEACDRYIARRAARIAESKERFIQRAMLPRKVFFGWIPVKGHTRQEAENLWQQGGLGTWSPADRAHMVDLKQWEEVCNLRSLALNTNKPTIYVDASKAFLFGLK